jgi:hypothetical protein
MMHGEQEMTRLSVVAKMTRGRELKLVLSKSTSSSPSEHPIRGKVMGKLKLSGSRI